MLPCRPVHSPTLASALDVPPLLCELAHPLLSQAGMRVCAADVLDARTLRLAIPVWLASYTVTKMGEAELPCSVCRRTCTGLMQQVRAPRSGVGGGARVAWSPTLACAARQVGAAVPRGRLLLP